LLRNKKKKKKKKNRLNRVTWSDNCEGLPYVYSFIRNSHSDISQRSVEVRIPVVLFVQRQKKSFHYLWLLVLPPFVTALVLTNIYANKLLKLLVKKIGGRLPISWATIPLYQHPEARLIG